MVAQGYLPPRNDPFDPPEMLGELRRRSGLSKIPMWDGRVVWMVTRHEDAQFVLRDSRFSADATNPRLPSLGPSRTYPMKRPPMSFVDEPRHGDLRGILNSEFLARRIDEMRRYIELVVAEQLDSILAAGPPVDLHAQFSAAVPWRVVTSLLGVPPDNRDMVQQWAKVLQSRDVTEQHVEAIRKEIYDYCYKLVSNRAKEPTDDLIGRMVDRARREGKLSLDDLATSTHLLIFAGYETTSHMFSLSTLTMLVHPDWFRALRERPEVVPNAVEELLRYHTVPDSLVRIAKEDVTVGGTRLAAGDGLVISLAAANRDSSVFPDADHLDIERPRARNHLAFGYGVHLCLGRWLARAELQIGLPAVAARIPTLRLAVPFEELSFREHMHVYGVDELPVTW
ncbi:MAG: cytochrome P450 [Carbonactinosporaceae bacterium]